jgi:hypothetical protein
MQFLSTATPTAASTAGPHSLASLPRHTPLLSSILHLLLMLLMQSFLFFSHGATTDLFSLLHPLVRRHVLAALVLNLLPLLLLNLLLFAELLFRFSECGRRGCNQK